MDALAQPLPETLSYSSRPGTPVPPAPLALSARGADHVDQTPEHAAVRLVTTQRQEQHHAQDQGCIPAAYPFPSPFSPTSLSCLPHKPRARQKLKSIMQPHQIHHPQPSYQPQRSVDLNKQGYGAASDHRFSVELQRQLSIQQWQERNSTAHLMVRSPPPGYPDTIDSYFAHGHLGQSGMNAHSENDCHADDENERDQRAWREGRNDNRKPLFLRHSSSTISQSARRRSRSACGALSPLSPEEMPSFYPRPTSFASSFASFGRATPMTRGHSMQLSPTLSRGTKTPPLPLRSPQPLRRRRHSCVTPNTEEFHRLATMFGWVTMSTPDSWHKRTGRDRRDLTTSRLDGADSPPQYSSVTQAVACDSEDDWDEDEFPQRRMFTEWDVSHDSSCLQSPIQDFHGLNGSIERLAALGEFGLASFPETLRTQWHTFSGESWKDQRTTVMESSTESTTDTARDEQDLLAVEFHKDQCLAESHPGSRASSSTDCLHETLFQDSQHYSTTERPPEMPTSSIYPPSMNHVDHPISTAQLDIDVMQSIEEANAPAAPPLVPPRFPEISARAFDLPAEEGPNMIVYASPSLPGQDSTSGISELPPIIAGTIVKLIEKLTHQYGMDTGFVTDFFLTYRLFMSPVQLCKYLIQRYLWALETETEHRLVVRVRTFVVLRYWIKEHFADDFLTSKSLRFQMASFLNQMRFHPSVKVSSLDARIIRYLMDFFKHQRKVYKSLAQQSLDTEHKQSEQLNPTQKGDVDPLKKGERDLDVLSMQMEDSKSAEVERLKVAAVRRDLEPIASNLPAMGGAESSHQPSIIKGRLRASTLASTPSRPMAGEPLAAQTHAKPPLSKECRAQSMARQTSEGGSLFARERRLSSSSTKSNRSTSNWSAKMTIGISKLRQKSEDIYQQFVHPSSGHYRGDTRLCVCWNSAYTGINEYHTLSTTRSFPNLRPSVVVTNVFQDTASPQASTANVSGPPSSRSIKRLKSSLSLGLSSSNTSPAPSPTRNQFSSISVRHSRSNSNTCTGYHPNPECPFHIPCQSATGKESLRSHREPMEENDNALKTLKEALQDEYVEAATQPPVPPLPSSIPASPAWQYSPWHTPGQLNSPSAASPSYKPFILFYRSQLIAQQLCLLEQHFLQQVKWDELLEIELTKAGRKNRAMVQSTISGYLFKTERNHNGMEASNERSNMLCMWVASEVVSTRPIEDRVRVIEKFIRIAQQLERHSESYEPGGAPGYAKRAKSAT
ncbi:Guanine nucleotide exchange factor lte1 [Mortierella antarctica]|nr:Guanine nucleotide exchange factor lte1 [Mortierella antarctica]